MPTIIDELTVVLGLDSTKFKTDVDQTTSRSKQAGDAAVKQGKELEEGLRKQQNATTSRLQQTEQVGRQTFQQFNRLRLEVLALFSSLATGYGIQQFIKNITASEANVGRLSKAIGNISTEDVSAFEQASERMGGSAEAAGQSMLGFSQALERMRITGEAAPFMPILRRMHVDLAEANGQARPLMAIMRDISAWMSQHQGPEAQAAGNMLGFDQGTINLLSSGKLEEALKRVKALGVTNEEDARRGQAFVETLHDFEQTLTRLGQVLVNDYLPDITKALATMTDWTTANRDWIKADIEEKLTAGIKYVKEFLAAVNEVVKAVGGWQNALEIVFGLWAASKVAPVLSAIGSITAAIVGLKTESLAVTSALGGLPAIMSALAALSVLFLSGDTPGGGDRQARLPDAEMQKRIDNYNREHPDAPIESFGGMMRRMWEGTRRFFGMPSGATDERMSGVRDELSQRLGISPAAASGIVSNLNAESGIQGINEVNPAIPGSRGGFGWAQWTGPRRDDFEAYAARNHLDPSSDTANMGFLVEELTTKYPQVLAQLRRGDISAREAADIVARGYIIPPSDKVEGHVSDAERISRIPHGGDPISKPSFHPAAFDPSLSGIGTVPPAASNVSNDNSRTSSTSNETHVGSIVINTAATDSDAIARGVGASLRKYAFVSNANYGLA